MATREVPTHPVEAEEQKESKGFLGKVKASGSSPAEAAARRRRGSGAGRCRRVLCWPPPSGGRPVQSASNPC